VSPGEREERLRIEQAVLHAIEHPDNASLRKLVDLVIRERADAAGLATLRKPTVPEVLPLVQALYARWDGGAGCCMHILLDDTNVDDDSARFCLQRARETGHPDCLALGELLVRMSKTQRRKLARHKRLK
jgi:hypothetical protein